MFSTATQCLRRFKLCYIDKVVPNVPESGDLAFGSALHSGLNSSIMGENGTEVFEIYWDSYQGKPLQYGRFKWAELRELGLNFLAKFQRLHANKYRVDSAEKRLYSSYKDVRLEGTYDFLGTYNGRKSLRDFKTSGYNYDKDKALCALQLNLYAYLALQNKLVDKIETLGYTVFNKGTGSIQDLTWEFSEKAMMKHLDNMVAYCKKFDVEPTDENFPCNPNSMLYPNKCPYFPCCGGE